jgi:Tol biopolymer transport system component
MKTNTIFNISIKLFIIIFISGFIFSCVPEAGPHNPSEYELDISISADKYAAVSHDGNLIAYFHESFEYPEPIDYPTGLYIMNSDVTNRRIILKGQHFDPNWSPDNQWLVFTSEGTLQIINLAGDSIRTHPGINNVPLFYPDWSPDGKLILFSSPYVDGGGGFMCSPDFSLTKQIYTHYILSAYPIKWFSSSEYIGSLHFRESPEEIFIVDTSLTNLKRLTFNSKSDRDPAASPSHEYIVWSSNVRIFIMNRNGSYQKMLDYGQYPSWSPGSDYIIYSNANQDVTKEVIWKIDINGNNKTQLTF